ncbi:hypothetical protein [Clostridium sp. HV4-5-A1G]|uniref:hypothetical protein n=1 Tax=Clostridium sp. HV4-5-A1G TaxID=2004595 RepID=UPI00123A099C|nr:hypothetical protein [Clostridium sp. HV4-5-A1G]KAA8673385.1 hypothetical protein F3O63_08830 [Clostridium sp. HV4-5-A1G]
MENFKYSINDISSEVFYMERANSGLKEILEKIMKFWNKFKYKFNQVVIFNDLYKVIDDILKIVFKDFEVENRNINKLKYMINTSKFDDKIQIEEIMNIRHETQALFVTVSTALDACSTIIKKLDSAIDAGSYNQILK